MTRSIEARYFAAMNTGNGFQSRFSEIFGGAKRLFIIKGGPGTGKSYFMRRCAEKAEKLGQMVEYFYCSSDPDSLDGIYIHGSDIAICDGTSPHAVEAVYPGVKDNLVDIGQFWNTSALEASASEIIALTDRRATLWKGVYCWLEAASKLEREYDSCIEKHILDQKLTAYIERMLRNLKPDGGEINTRILSAISMKGEARFDTFDALAEQRFVLSDRYRISHRCYEIILNRLSILGVSANVSYSPLIPSKIDALFIPSIKTAVVTQNESYERRESDRIISCSRFISLDTLKSERMKLRFIKRCESELMNGAYKQLDEIRSIHFELEAIYGSAMDFAAKEKCTEAFIENEIN